MTITLVVEFIDMKYPVSKFYNDYYIYDFFENRSYQLMCVGRMKCLMEEYLPVQEFT